MCGSDRSPRFAWAGGSGVRDFNPGLAFFSSRASARGRTGLAYGRMRGGEGRRPSPAWSRVVSGANAMRLIGCRSHTDHWGWIGQQPWFDVGMKSQIPQL